MSLMNSNIELREKLSCKFRLSPSFYYSLDFDSYQLRGFSNVSNEILNMKSQVLRIKENVYIN